MKKGKKCEYLTLTKSRLHSLALEPNCHLHCVSALYSCPGSCSGYLYWPICLGSSTRQDAWAVLMNIANHPCQSGRRQQQWQMADVKCLRMWWWWCLPKETAEVLTTTGGPREDPVVSSESGRHYVALCFATRVSLPIMDHPKTGEKRINSDLND